MAIHLHDQRHPVKTPVNKLVPATRKHRGGDERHGQQTARAKAFTCSASPLETHHFPAEAPVDHRP